METTNNLYQKLWSASDDLRNFMDANEYKNYLLGIIFYKYLSDKQLKKIGDLLELETDDLEQIQVAYEDYLQTEDADLLLEELKYQDGFIIKAQYTFTNLIKEINEGTFQLDNLKQAFNDIERSDENFEGLFDDVDLYSNRLGKSLQDKNKRIANVMKQISGINLAEYSGDILGDAYEYMISNFAKVNKEDLEFLIANYPIEKKEVKKPLGEDKLIKNANKDLYNEASGENLSLLKFKSMLRKDTHKFIDQKIRPYFE